MVALAVLVLVGGIFAIGVVNAKAEQKKQQIFSWLADKLGGGFDIDENHAWGELANAHVSYRFRTRGGGKSRSCWTEIEAEIPPQYPLRLFIRKHGWVDHRKIERGEMVDVIVGDPAFDNQFLVEAAPADVARLLVDPRERAYLLDLSDRLWLEVTTHHEADRAFLKLAIRSSIFDFTDAMRAIEAIAAIAGRLREAYSAVEAAAETEATGSPYRPILDDGAAKQAAEARLQEVERVDDLRTERTANEQALAVAIIILFVVVAIFAMAASH